ncbi:MAG TPA: TetR/AcrR family transcriptional regulator [Bacillota bacterium]|nr:TetR/AcrR family transcriptional regulator [Bacillota bacterium]
MTRLSHGGDTIPKQTFLNLEEDKQKRIIDAAIDEFALHSFEHANLSNIVRASGIPRGSFYQYFEDKFDIYHYIFELVKDRKMAYLQDLLANPEDKPFLDLFRDLFISGSRFAMDNPKMVKVFSHVLSAKDEIYDRIVKDSLGIAMDYYTRYIKSDQEKGRIRKDIDPEVFAKLVIDMTMNISIDEIKPGSADVNYQDMQERITQILKIIEHGVVEGE